jgi:hypothetical protein
MYRGVRTGAAKPGRDAIPINFDDEKVLERINELTMARDLTSAYTLSVWRPALPDRSTLSTTASSRRCA